MKVEKETIIRVKTTDGKEAKDGDSVILVANGVVMYGVFSGITNRGALEFCMMVDSEPQIIFRIMPRSIEKMYLAELNIFTDSNIPFGK